MLQVCTVVIVNSQLSDFGKDLLQNSSDMLLWEMKATELLGTVSHLFATDRYKFEASAIPVYVSGTSQSLEFLGDFARMRRTESLIKLNMKPVISMKRN